MRWVGEVGGIMACVDDQSEPVPLRDAPRSDAPPRLISLALPLRSLLGVSRMFDMICSPFALNESVLR